MGISILFQTPRYSRLNLARSLPWLAAFGILHGLYEWGDIFIPIQLAASGSAFEIVLDGLHLIVLALSFSALFQFGVELIRPYSKRWRFLRILPATFFTIWAIVPFVVGFIFLNDIELWHEYANTFSRYLLCIPAFIFSAVGLTLQVNIQINPLKYPQIGRMLKLSAGAIVIYGIVEVLSVPPADFFPASVFNGRSFTTWLIAPPYAFRAVAGLVLLYAMLRAIRVFNFETERRIHQMEIGQVIATERERIARDLHDGALQQVYASGLIAQTLRKHVQKEAQSKVDELTDVIDQAIEKLRAFLTQDQPVLESVDLAGALTPIIEEARHSIAIDTSWNTRQIPSLTPDQTRHLRAFVSEALSNVIRHSQSPKADVSVFCSDHHLNITVRDYGKGIGESAEPGFGLKNMRDRARLLGATLKIESKVNTGTLLTLDLPMEEKDDSDSSSHRG